MNKFAQALSAALDLCVATKEISVSGRPVGFMYREEPVFDNDSGWRFFSGDESDGYTDNPDNFTVCGIGEITASNPDILPLLQEKAGAWETGSRKNKTVFQTASGRLNVFERTPQRVKRNIRPAVSGQGYQPERKSS